MSEHDIVMLYSGGADSLLMLHFALMAKKVPYCLLIDYDQKHISELDFAQTQLDKLGIVWQVVKVKDLNVDSGLTGIVEEGRWDNVNEMNVPARNTIFIGLAMSVAENMDIDEVWYGPDYSDRENLFPDCYQEYVFKMNEMMAISGVRPIKLVAPLLGMTKELILDILGHHFKVQEGSMFSGYYPAESHACKCGNDQCECV